MNKSENLQETFLNQIRKEKLSVTIFLINGVKLQGIITWFDNFSILLISCNVTKTDDDGNQISEKDLKATSSAQEQKKLSLEVDKDQLKNNEKTLLSNPYLDSLGSFSSDVLKTAMRSLQHTYWVMAEASEMNKYLNTAGIELVGEPIVPGNDKKAEFLDYGIVMSGGQAYVVTEMDKVIVAFRDTGSDKRWERTKKAYDLIINGKDTTAAAIDPATQVNAIVLPVIS